MTSKNLLYGVGKCKWFGCDGEVMKTEIQNPLTGKVHHKEEPGFLSCQSCGALHFFQFNYELYDPFSDKQKEWECLNKKERE